MKEIRNIIAAYDRFKLEKIPLALAAVVHIEESSYRRIGARMLVAANGTWTGGISGGCLEGDALKKSKLAIHKNTPTTVIYDTLEEDENQIGIGLGCNGKIEVLFSPIDINNSQNEVEQLKEIVLQNKACILLKIIESFDAPQLLGQTTIVSEQIQDLNFGGIDLEKIKTAIQSVRIKRRPQIIALNNLLHQSLKLLVEYIRPETRLVIIGDNYDVMAMIGVANELGWQIHLVGNQQKISKVLYAKSKKVYAYEHVDAVPIDEYTAVVFMTHDFNWDKILLPKIIEKNPPYIGMLGPKKRAQKMAEELHTMNLKQLDIFHSPVGLDIGAETPEEIALSIAAEIIAIFRKRSGQSLKKRLGTIHTRFQIIQSLD